MTKNQEIYVTKQANNKGQTFVDADSTTKKDLFVAAAEGSVLRSLSACSDDTAAVNMQLWLYDGSTAYLMGTVNIPIASGSDGTANAVNLLNSMALPFLKIDNAGNRIITLETGWTIQGSVLAAVTANKTVYITAHGEDY